MTGKRGEKKHYWFIDRKKYNKKKGTYTDSFHSSFWNTFGAKTGGLNISWDGHKKMYHGTYTKGELRRIKKVGLTYKKSFIFMGMSKIYSKTEILNEFRYPNSSYMVKI